MPRLKQVTICCAELCQPLPRVKVQVFAEEERCVFKGEANNQGVLEMPESFYVAIFSLNGYQPKRIVGGCPEVVRLLDNRLQGYMDKLGYNPGDEISVKVHSTDAFKATLCRHGSQVENYLDLGKYNPHVQQVPDDYFVECGISWKESFQCRLPESAPSGLYSVRLETATSVFSIPFIVSAASKKHASRSRVVVLASTNTWVSYNIWGGRSRYRNFENNQAQHIFTKQESIRQALRQSLLKRVRQKIVSPTIKLVKRVLGLRSRNHWVHKRMSTKRPFTNTSLTQSDAMEPFTSHLAAGEWRILAWLEREGIDYDVITGHDLDKDSLLEHYSAVILSTHSEYWSSKMYEHLVRAHQQYGLWILNLSGNSIYREIEFFDDGSTRCVELQFQKSDRDETELLGVRFSMTGYGTSAPFKVTKPNHWIFEGIPGNTKTFGGSSLNRYTEIQEAFYNPGRPMLGRIEGDGASGWETDKLSSRAIKMGQFERVAKGMNPDGGGADMVVKDPQGNMGGLFSASSITFGGALLIDDVCSRLTINVIKKALSEPTRKTKA